MSEAGAKRRFSRDSISNTLLVAIAISLVCSVVVSSAAILLRPLQAHNENLFRQKIVLEVAGLYEPGADIGASFGEIDVRIVDLGTGEYTDAVAAGEFDALAAANDAETGIAIPGAQDIAGIRRRSMYAPVYLVRDQGSLQQVILPVYGKGLWSTMLGYLALEADGDTIRGLQFYEHGETPGLGDQIDKAAWRAQWSGKRLSDGDGEVLIKVVRGKVQPGDDAVHQVDGLSGATLTGRGVTNLVRYWTGPHGFGPYLDKLRKESGNDG